MTYHAVPGRHFLSFSSVEPLAHGWLEVIDKTVHDRDQVQRAAIELSIFVMLASLPELPHSRLQPRVSLQCCNPPAQRPPVLIERDEALLRFDRAGGFVQKRADLSGAQQVMEDPIPRAKTLVEIIDCVDQMVQKLLMLSDLGPQPR